MSTESPGMKLAGSDFATDRREQSVGSAFKDYWDKLRSGDLGSLPAVLGLVGLIILFWAMRPETFMSKGNFANLLVQALPTTILALGLVFVLLLGEIDLSAGVTSGVCAAVMAKLMFENEMSWPVTVSAAVVTGLAIGLLLGWLVSVIRIPSFVVSLALFLGLQGVTLRLVGEGGNFPVRDDFVVALANKNMPVWMGWALAILVSAAISAGGVYRWQRLRARGLMPRPLALVVTQGVAISVVLLSATYVLSQDRAPSPLVNLAGIPWGVLLVMLLVVVCTFVLSRTAYGRHVYAVGGNAEAARRAGINVTKVRMSVFVIGSVLAAISGIVAASRLNSVAPGAGAGNDLLYAVGAAVIGGTSLFGGRGKALDAVIGGLVIAVIANGLGLLGTDAFLNFLITGGVLLLAATIDALARRRLAASAR